jgi:eukaryotic-like serine/threonine-protein kinase
MDMLAGRYELGPALGSGGMAQVFAAHDRVLDRSVAIKLIHHALSGDPVGRERFVREARVAAGLQHPNTVGVFDVGDDGGRPFIVMELVRGQSLADRLREGGPLAADEAVAMSVAVLDGLGAAHERGLVHRDVKPSNILLPDDGGVKLADFGVAIAVADAATRLTSAGQVLGTPRYLAPECAGGQLATPASDLYSLGAVMYECLAGRPPFEAGTPVALAVAHQREPVPLLSEVAPQVPAPVAAVVERALEKNPDVRFADAAEMRRAVVAAAESGAFPPTLPLAVSPVATAMLPGGPVESTYGWPDAHTGHEQDDGDDWGRERNRTVPTIVAAIGVLAVLAALVAVGYLLLGDDPADEAAPDGAEEPAAGEQDDAAEQPDDAAAGDEDDPVEDQQPEAAEPTLDELIADLEADPATAGERGDDLLDELRDIRDVPAAEDMRDLVEEIAEWLADRELDAETGRIAVTVLEQDSRPDAAALHDVSRLFADVALTLPEWGEKGEDLLSDLADLLDTEPPGQQLNRAREIVDDLVEWSGKGEIDVSRAAAALAVLQSIASRS